MTGLSSRQLCAILIITVLLFGFTVLHHYVADLNYMDIPYSATTPSVQTSTTQTDRHSDKMYRDVKTIHGNRHMYNSATTISQKEKMRYKDSNQPFIPPERTNHFKGQSPSYCGVTYSESMDLLVQEPIKPLPEFKNPCWYMYDGAVFRCFPYFFLTGFPKCGTTDIYNRLYHHPQYVASTQKEYHWLSKSRFYKRITLSNYLKSFYSNASRNILEQNRDDGNEWSAKAQSPFITGDSSATYIFDNDFWMLLPGNRNSTEPVYTNPHYIRHLYPQARIIISVRNPIERLWSDFLYSSRFSELMTPENFHRVVVKAIGLYQDCFKERSIRSCVYDRKLYILSTTSYSPAIVTSPNWKCPQIFKTNVHLRLGLYSVYIKEYLQVFPRDQVHVLRLEDFSRNITDHMQTIYEFLGIDRLSKKRMDLISGLAKRNTRANTKKAIGTMKNETRILLYEFYKPFNEDLARLLGDQRYNYDIK